MRHERQQVKLEIGREETFAILSSNCTTAKPVKPLFYSILFFSILFWMFWIRLSVPAFLVNVLYCYYCTHPHTHIVSLGSLRPWFDFLLLLYPPTVILCATPLHSTLLYCTVHQTTMLSSNSFALHHLSINIMRFRLNINIKVQASSFTDHFIHCFSIYCTSGDSWENYIFIVIVLYTHIALSIFQAFLRW